MKHRPSLSLILLSSKKRPSFFQSLWKARLIRGVRHSRRLVFFFRWFFFVVFLFFCLFTRQTHTIVYTLHTPPPPHTHHTTQVSALQSRLESTTIELQTVVRQTGEKESLLTQQLEELRQEKALREKDFKMTRCVCVCMCVEEGGGGRGRGLLYVQCPSLYSAAVM